MSFAHHYINVTFSPRRLGPVDSLWNPAISECVREDGLSISAVKCAGLSEVSAGFAVSAEFSQRNQHQAASQTGECSEVSPKKQNKQKL